MKANPLSLDSLHFDIRGIRKRDLPENKIPPLK
jgi:hypothetical protein